MSAADAIATAQSGQTPVTVVVVLSATPAASVVVAVAIASVVGTIVVSVCAHKTPPSPLKRRNISGLFARQPPRPSPLPLPYARSPSPKLLGPCPRCSSSYTEPEPSPLVVWAPYPFPHSSAYAMTIVFFQLEVGSPSAVPVSSRGRVIQPGAVPVSSMATRIVVRQCCARHIYTATIIDGAISVAIFVAVVIPRSREDPAVPPPTSKVVDGVFAH